MQGTTPPKTFARSRRVVVGAVIGLALLYVLLLIPEGKSPVPPGAGRQPFVWNQNSFWSELERQFVAARATGCETLTGRIDVAVTEINRLLGDISEKPLVPEDATFALLETNLFQLAPMVGACPQRLHDYITLVTRTRAEVKKQSQHWDLNSPVSRERIYRLLFGTRMALEEVMLQASSQADVPPVILCNDEPSQTPASNILGATIHRAATF